MKFLPLIMLAPFAKLVVDDFRRREVSVWWLVATAAMATGVAAAVEGWRGALINSGINLLVIVYMAVGVTVWAWVRSRRLINPVNRFIGLGDVLFFVALTPLFPIKTFAWLLVACMVFSLAWWRSTRRVPLVATSGIVVCAAIILDLFL
ncbi:MAG: hypothetical protein LBR57_03735 [Alistipes sp.]|jgi:hypothetical protein|nr:hypothetical protein [Alistipes sp.]